MAWTRHGHQISFSPVEAERPSHVVRCGGPYLCQLCAKDDIAYNIEHSSGPVNTQNGMPDRSFAAPLNDLQEIARKEVFAYVKKRLEKTDMHITFSEDEVYVVWWSKVLQNWKALVSTSLPDGMYYEVTYNGDKHELYIDAYKKFDNVVVPLA